MRHKVSTTVSRTLVKKVEKEETTPLFAIDRDRPLVTLPLARLGFGRMIAMTKAFGRNDSIELASH
jgi:hypothetical protein